MTCVRIGGAIVCLGGKEYVIEYRGKKWRFEDHAYCGPMAIGKNGDPVTPPPDGSPFWEVVSLWYAQGKRTRPPVGNEVWCIYDKPTMQKMRHIGGNNYELVTDK